MTLNPYQRIRDLEAENKRLSGDLAKATGKRSASASAAHVQHRAKVMAKVDQLRREMAR